MLDSSKVVSFLTCPRRYYWRYVEDLVPLTTPSAPSFGAAIHRALEAWYKTGDVQAAIDTFKSIEFESSGRRTLEQGIKNLMSYFVARNTELKTTLTPVDSYVEVGFVGELEGLELYGRIDRICRDSEGHLVVEDWKTTARLSDSYGAQRYRDVQGATYQYIVQATLDEPAYFRFDVLPIRKDSEPVRFMVDYNRQLPAWAKLVLNIAKQIQQCSETGEWPENWLGCWTFNSQCPYFELCQHPEIKERLIALEFKRSHWDPLKKEKQSEEQRSV